MQKYVLAADLGGTNLRMAAVAEDGSVLHLIRSATPESGGREAIAEAITISARECVSALGPGVGPLAIGLAVPALISRDGSIIFNSPNLPDLGGADLAGSIDVDGIEVFIENDANAAAVGEHWLGGAKGTDTSICITLGTGVGGGIILGGQVWRGADGTAGEIGHVCVEPFGAKCGCGSFGCLEQYASATAITRMAAELLPEYKGSMLSGLDENEISSEDIFEAGMAGDKLAIEVFRRAGFYLGTVVAGLLNVLNPEVIVVGGGAAAGWDLFIGEFRNTVTAKAFQVPAERVRIVRAELGDHAGILGAARRAFALGHRRFETGPL